MNLNLIHIYKNAISKPGGIESYIRGMIEVMNTFANESIQSSTNRLFMLKLPKEIKKIVLHGYEPICILSLLFYYFFYRKKQIYWVPYFHPARFCRRPKRQMLIYHFMLGLVCRNLDMRILLFNQSQCDDFMKELHWKRHNNIKLINMGFTPLHRTQTKRDFIYKTDYKYDFIAVARNVAVKRLDWYLQFARLKPNYRFCLVSDMSNRDNLPNVSVYRYANEQELINLLQQSKMYLSTSQYESFGIAIAEAEYLGIPSIYSLDTGYAYPMKSQEIEFPPDIFFYQSFSELISKAEHLLSKIHVPEIAGKLQRFVHQRANEKTFEANIENLRSFFE